jgi:hypothetical protein
MGKPWGTQAFIVCAAAPVVGVAALRDIQKKHRKFRRITMLMTWHKKTLVLDSFPKLVHGLSLTVRKVVKTSG